MSTKISLKAARVNADLTLDEASKLLEINRNTLMKWEREPWMISALYMDKISKVYNLSINDINFLPIE